MKWRQVRLTIVSVAAFVTACSSGPGAPSVRTDAGDGQGPLIYGCRNVSATDATDKFIVGSYLTTWGSVWQEGTVLPDPPDFCRSFPVAESDVTGAVLAVFDEVLRPLGYDFTFDDSRGLLQTEYVGQEHEMAMWRDRFTVAIVALESHRTVVSVQRDVEILHKYGSTKKAFYPGVSVGRNEAWILSEVGRRLGAE